MENKNIQHYAISKSGVLTHINVAHGDLDDYYCPSCNCRMQKKCGHIRSWHFAHDPHYANEIQKNCSYESYLHCYAKLRFKEWFDNASSIILYITPHIICEQYDNCIFPERNLCSIEEPQKEYDLKRYFDSCIIECTIETPDGKYRPDLLLSSESNKNRQLLIEINVTHECTEKKKSSNLKIIEFDIDSEEDVDNIISNNKNMRSLCCSWTSICPIWTVLVCWTP